MPVKCQCKDPFGGVCDSVATQEDLLCDHCRSDHGWAKKVDA